MEPLRLDPDDPLASLLRWLKTLAAALGLAPGALLPKVDRRGAADVRFLLSDWSRKLRALVRARAIRLALAMRDDATRTVASSPFFRGRREGGRPEPGDAAARRDVPPPASGLRPSPPPPPAGEDTMISIRLDARRRPWGVFAVSPRRRETGARKSSRPAWWEQPDAPIGPAEDAALRRRLRAVLLALKDSEPLVRRLARRLFSARRAIPSRGPARKPRPPRTLGAAPSSLARKPEPRPPDAGRELDAQRLPLVC